MATEHDSLRARARLKEWQFTSHLPIVGRLISVARNGIFSIASRWPLRFMQQQQSEFNERVLDFIEEAQRDRQQETERVAALQSALERANSHILNLERQAIENDQAAIETRHDIAELGLAFVRAQRENSEWREAIKSRLDVADQRLDLELAEQASRLEGHLKTNIDQLQEHLKTIVGQLREKVNLTDQAFAQLVEAQIKQDDFQSLSDQMSVTAERLAQLPRIDDRIDQLHRDIESLRETDELLIPLIADVRGELRSRMLVPEPNGKSAVVSDQSAPSSQIDYFLFEMRYRGSTDEIAKRHEPYLKYFSTSDMVVDLGCGRGEFLKLLIDHGIEARGVDLDPDMVAYCQQVGLPVERGDVIEFLSGIEDNSLGGIFLGQVIEHLPPNVLAQVIQLAHRKLKPDAHFVAETINPMCLLALTTHYLLDMSHVRPVHPEVMRFLLSLAGFREITVQFSAPVPDDVRLKRFPATDSLSETEMLWLPLLNEDIDRLNDFLYGNQDYAIVARKFAWPERLAEAAARRSLLVEA